MHRGMFVLVAVAAIQAPILCTSSASAATYDAVADFNTTNNPNGVWTYYASNDTTASPDVLLSAVTADPPFIRVTNGQGEPDNVSITKNASDTSHSLNTYSLPPEELNLDPQSNAVLVRFTAPTAGIYTIDASFYGLDDHSRGVSIVENGGTSQVQTLLSEIHSGAGWTESYDESLSLEAQDTLDFVVYATDFYTYLGTGFSAQITSAPEPATMSLLGVGLAGLLLKRRRV